MLVSCGQLRLPKKKESAVKKFGQFLLGLDWNKIKFVVVEKAWVGAKGFGLTVAINAELIGLVKGLALALNVDWLEIDAKAARKTVVGTGRAPKKLIKEILTERFDERLTQHQADAIALGLYGLGGILGWRLRN